MLNNTNNTIEVTCSKAKKKNTSKTPDIVIHATCNYTYAQKCKRNVSFITRNTRIYARKYGQNINTLAVGRFFFQSW